MAYIYSEFIDSEITLHVHQASYNMRIEMGKKKNLKPYPKWIFNVLHVNLLHYIY